MSQELKNMFGTDISGIIFEYLSGEDYDDVIKANEYIRTESQLFLFDNDNVEWTPQDINEVCKKGWIDLVKHKKFNLTKNDLINALRSGNVELIEYILGSVEPDRLCLITCISHKPELFKKLWDKTSKKTELKRVSCVNECIKNNKMDLLLELYREPSDIDFTSLKIACIERHDAMVEFISNDNAILSYMINLNWNFLAYLIQNEYYDTALSLIKTHPSLITIKCINEACVSGNDKILLACLEKESGYIDYAYYGVDIACSKGYVNIIRILDQYGYLFSDDSINETVENGHLSLTMFLYEVHELVPAEFAIIEAATNGHIDVLKWLYATKLINVVDINDVMMAACCNNKLDIVKWLGKKITPLQICMDCACERNSLDVAKYLHEQYNMFCTDTSFDVAASEGNIEMIVWLTSIGNKATSNAIDSCAATNEFTGLKWLIEIRKEIGTTWALDNAVKRGNIEMTKYLLDNDYRISNYKVLAEALTYNTFNKNTCVMQVLERYNELFDVNILPRCSSFSCMKKLLRYCDKSDLSLKVIYKIILNAIKCEKLKIIKFFIPMVIEHLDEEDKIELLNMAEYNKCLKNYLEMRLLRLPDKIDYLFDILSHINLYSIHSLEEQHWRGQIITDGCVVADAKNVFRMITEVDETNINKYAAVCYLIALQAYGNSLCIEPIKFTIEILKMIEKLEVKPEEQIETEFDLCQIGSMIKNIIKKIN